MAQVQDIAPWAADIPWLAKQLAENDVVCSPFGSLLPKPSGEDMFFAKTIHSKQALQGAFHYYRRPAADADTIDELATVFRVSNGLDGHPGILHGGIVATFMDECFGAFILEDVRQAQRARALREGTDPDAAARERTHLYFTADLRTRYLRKVETPGTLVITVRRTKREGRKEWLSAELKQWQPAVDASSAATGQLVVCSTAETLFISVVRPKL